MEAILIFVVMTIFMLVRIPVVFAMGLTATLGVLVKGIPLDLVPQRMFYGLNSFVLMSIPLFVFVGEVMNIGGITMRIFNFARAWLRHIRGGLGHVNIVASVIFAGMSGSAVADAYGLGLVEIEAMKEDGYDSDFTAGITAASSTIGPIIPPSIPLVVYAVIVEESVGKLFLGGLIPGLLMAISLMIMVYFISKKRGYKVEPKASLKERLIVTVRAIPSLLTPIILLAGIVFGVVTPTEGAALVGVYALFLGFVVYRELGIKELHRILLKTIKGSSTILIIISSASVLTWLITASNVPQLVADGLLALTDNKYMLLILINLAVLLLGCFLEGNTVIMVVVPVLMPLCKLMGIDMVHFGVFFVLNTMIGLLTPPFGMCLYVVSSVAKISFGEMTKAVIPFAIPLVIVLFLTTFIPDLVLFLPNLLMGAK